MVDDLAYSYVRRQQRQKWELAEVSLEHLRLCLRTLEHPAASMTDASLAARPPGVAVMLDLLGTVILNL